MALTNVANGIAKKSPQNPQIPPKNKTEITITTGCSLFLAEKSKGTKTLPSRAWIIRYIPKSHQKSADIPHSYNPTSKTGTVTKIAPKKGIMTDRPTNKASKKVYGSPRKLKAIKLTEVTIKISMSLPVT
tara:strand:+ start:224 stop:613 length:390 start_codon:yes stop_codon:yes gene_type:complete